MQKRHTCAAFFFMRESEAKLSPFWRKSHEKEKKNCIPHKPRDLTQFKGEISCKKRRSKLDIFPYEKWSYATDFKESYFDAQKERGRKIIVNSIQLYRIKYFIHIQPKMYFNYYSYGQFVSSLTLTALGVC